MITPPGSLPRNVFGRPFLHCKWRALDISDLHRQSIVGHFMIGITILGRNTIQIQITYNIVSRGQPYIKELGIILVWMIIVNKRCAKKLDPS